jgi:hypothetical protein
MRGPAAALLLLFLIVYGFDCGSGFISDDFAWILHSRWRDARDILWPPGSGAFYRPLVSLSFGLNHAMFGLDARGYGWTNLALTLACAAALAVLARQLRLPAAAALAAAAIWAFNFHGINMAVLWLSGRTSLFVTLFALLAATAWLRGWPLATVAAVAAALLSKEEAVALPAVLSIWALAVGRAQARNRWRDLPRPSGRALAAAWAILPVYLALRASAGAFWFSTAPSYYQPAFDLGRLAANAPQYADRALTTAALAVLLSWIAVRARFAISERTRAMAVLGTTWVVLFYAITVFLPVRSSLYAVLPSAGAALVAASLVSDIVAPLTAARRQRLAWAGVAVVLLLTPVYRSRNTRWTELGALSSGVIAQLAARRPELPAAVAIVDDGATRANLSNAWGQLVPEMVQVVFDGTLDVTVHPAGSPVAPQPGRAVLQLRGGQLRP